MATLKNVTINDTGFVQTPPGTTAQRITPVNGDIRYNTDTGKNEMYSNSIWVALDGTASSDGKTTIATGGTVTISGGMRIHTFTTVGAATFSAPYTGRAEVLVVAAGGGGSGIGGGGGAGGYIYNQNFPIVGGQSYSINVGTGGAGETSHSANNAAQGGNSTFGSPLPSGTLTAIGGGRGVCYNSGAPPASGNGGSGGGGCGGLGHPVTNYSSYPGEHPGGVGTPGQGHPGGYGHHGSGPGYPNPCNQPGGANHAGGGGGGAGSKGQSKAAAGMNSFGGAGIANSITGSSVIYAAGGGGGTHDWIYAYSPNTGGAEDGTGNSGRPPSHPSGTLAATAGGTNRGGGGGGASHPAPDASGAGGPGIVVIRYRY
jgi:hypothetical protein